jgi:hypothetical protein
MEQPSANVRIATSSLVATLFSLGLGVALGLARQHPMPGMIITVNGTVMTLGLLALPLVWWQHKLGYACAIAVGLINVIGDVFAIASGMPFSEGMPQGTIAVIISQIVVSALVICFCMRAWRE